MDDKIIEHLQADLNEAIEMQSACFTKTSEMWWWITGRRATLELVLLRAGVELESNEGE